MNAHAVLNVVRIHVHVYVCTLPASYSGRIHVYNSDDCVVLVKNQQYRPKSIIRLSKRLIRLKWPSCVFGRGPGRNFFI